MKLCRKKFKCFLFHFGNCKNVTYLIICRVVRFDYSCIHHYYSSLSKRETFINQEQWVVLKLWYVSTSESAPLIIGKAYHAFLLFNEMLRQLWKENFGTTITKYLRAPLFHYIFKLKILNFTNLNRFPALFPEDLQIKCWLEIFHFWPTNFETVRSQIKRSLITRATFTYSDSSKKEKDSFTS